jgi:hypothetical protein
LLRRGKLELISPGFQIVVEVQTPAACAPLADCETAAKSKIAFAVSKHWPRFAMRDDAHLDFLYPPRLSLMQFSSPEQSECSTGLPVRWQSVEDA